MSQGKRYKFQGSKIQVSLGVDGAPFAISGIDVMTDGTPIVTATGSNLALGAVGRIAAVVGMTELNGNLYVADNPTANDFDLAGVDASGYNEYVSGGTFSQLAYSQFCELTGVDQQDGTSDEIDATTVCSTAKEFETGLSDSGTLTMNYNYAPISDIQAGFRAAKKAGDQVAVRIVFPNNGGTIVMIGSVQQSSFSGSNGTLWTGTTQLKLTGDIFVLEA